MKNRNDKNTFRLRRSINKKTVVLTILLALLLTAGIGAWMLGFSTNNQASTDATPTEETINFNPPTEEDKEAVDAHKQELSDQQENQVSQDSNKPLSIVITDASQYNDIVEVRAYSPDIYEEGGICTYTFTKNSLTLKKTSTAHRDAKTTYCSTLTVQRSEFPEAGAWNLELTLTSQERTGSAKTGVSIK